MSYWTDEIERLRERDGEHARAIAAERRLEEIRKINDIANARLDASDKIAVELKAAKSNLEYYREARDLAVDKKVAAEKKLKELSLRVHATHDLQERLNGAAIELENTVRQLENEKERSATFRDASETWMKATHELQRRLNGAAIELENTVRQLENVRIEREVLRAAVAQCEEEKQFRLKAFDEYMVERYDLRAKVQSLSEENRAANEILAKIRTAVATLPHV